MNTVREVHSALLLARQWTQPYIRSALNTHDFTAVYKRMQSIGYSQQAIARRTSQSQPEVSAILHNRRVLAYEVIERITRGLGIPRCLVGMGTCCCHTQCRRHPAGLWIPDDEQLWSGEMTLDHSGQEPERSRL